MEISKENIERAFSSTKTYCSPPMENDWQKGLAVGAMEIMAIIVLGYDYQRDVTYETTQKEYNELLEKIEKIIFNK
jgi:phosphotransferase system HPr-like phosphotransfer protein